MSGDAGRGLPPPHAKTVRLQIALAIVLFEIALAGALFCFATRRGSGALGVATAGALGLITVAALALFMNGWPGLDLSVATEDLPGSIFYLLPLMEKPMALAIGIACIVIWSALAARGTKQRPGGQALLRGAAVCFQLALSVAAAWALSRFFLLKFYGLINRAIIPRSAIFSSLAGGQVCGAMLVYASFLGLNQLAHWRELGPDDHDDGLLRAGRLVCIGVGLRAAWIVASIMTGGIFEPMALRSFFGMRSAETIGLIGARIILGLLLPLMYGLLVQASVREHRRRQAAIQFAPITLLVLLGELLGAGLTVGMWGLAL